MRGSIFLFATDLHDEGPEVVLENVQGRGGLGGVTLACAYHHARDLFPHNPVRKVRFLEGGTVFFRPDPRRYERLRIKPQVSRLAAEIDVLGDLIARAGRRGLAVRAWTVYLHNTTLGSRYPECAPRNVFGDPYITNLCPANPDVRAYARALSADLARHGVESIVAESLGWGGFDHGYHHERAFIPLSPVARFLLGLCFCEHCMRAIGAAGVAVERVRGFVRAELERVLDGEPTALPEGEAVREELAALAGGELGPFLAARETIVTGLVAEVREAVEATGATRFVAMDMAGAAKGYATGEPTGAPAPASAWREGLDPARVGKAAHGLAAIGYARDPARLRLDLDAYRALLPARRTLSVALRPMPPDCDAAANLAAKVAVLRGGDVTWADFYHYGFMRLHALDWIREALAG
ncbi:MAG: hypothetical protein M3Q65_26475 [Chloroflexota bacterium]|nr:hypothetical protein [Chloroflexota bacterium]